MKKSLIILPFLSLLVGYGGDSIYEKYADYNMLRTNVEIAYESGRVVYPNDLEFDLSRTEFFNKAKPSEAIKTLIPGDKLEIFYDDNKEIKDVLVEKSDYVVAKVTVSLPEDIEEWTPMFLKYHFEDKKYKNDYVHAWNIEYIIDSSRTYRTFYEHDFNDFLYIVFDDEQSQTDVLGEPVHIPLAVYSFKPR